MVWKSFSDPEQPEADDQSPEAMHALDDVAITPHHPRSCIQRMTPILSHTHAAGASKEAFRKPRMPHNLEENLPFNGQ